jgi:iron(III) transport system permease protein
MAARAPQLIPGQLAGSITGRLERVSRTGARRLLRPKLPWMLVLPALLVAAAMLTPVVYLIIRTSEAGSDVWGLIFRERTAVIFWNTLMLAAGVSGAAILIAVPYAWLTTRTDLPVRRLWETLAPLPLVIPSYAGTLAVIGAVGPRGMVQQWLEPLGIERLPSIYGYTGAWLTLTLFTYPYVYLSVRAALRGLDPSLEEASRSLSRGSWQTFFRCVLPQLRPAIVSGALLSALYTVSDFGVVTLMRYDAFTRTIYTQYRSAFDRTLAAGLGLLLVLFALSLVVGEGKLRNRGSYHRLGSGAARAAMTIPLGRWRGPAIAFCALVPLLALGVPIATLLYWLFTGTSTGNQFGDLPGAALNSMLIGLYAAVVAMAAALPVAILAVRYRKSRFSRMMERTTYLGYALPGIVIALAFVFLGARYLTPIYQTLPLLVLAMVVRFIPQGVGAARTSLLQVSPRLEESSRSLGRGGFGTILRITVPLAWPGISAGAALVFLTVLKELPITLLLSPTGFDTLATEIWAASEGGAYGRAAAPALLLIGLSMIPTLLLAYRTSTRSARTADDDEPAETESERQVNNAGTPAALPFTP